MAFHVPTLNKYGENIFGEIIIFFSYFAASGQIFLTFQANKASQIVQEWHDGKWKIF
jgi:hypothetical protein